MGTIRPQPSSQARGAYDLRQAVLERGTVPVVVVGTSMEPTLYSGDVIVVEAAVQPERGQLLTFAHGDGTTVVTHRVLHVRNDAVICRGGNRRFADPPPSSALCTKPSTAGRFPPSTPAGFWPGSGRGAS